MITLHPGSVEDFRLRVAKRLGLYFEEAKRDFLADVLCRRIAAGKHDGPNAYFRALEEEASREETGELAEALTVTETFFFRNADHFRALIEEVLPNRLRIRSANQKLRILSAGCASGEEPFSLAMAIQNHFPELSSWDIRIKAVDMNPAMLAKAKAGRYTSWALRNTPEWARERHFTTVGKDFQLADDIRSAVSFESRNLSEANPDLWESENFDLILCRNMIMYFVPEAAAKLVSRMAASLTPGGYLFLGYAETLRGLSHDYHLCHTHGTFYYQHLKDNHSGPPVAHAWPAEAPSRIESGVAAPVWDPTATWVEVIQRASDKIAGLAARPVLSPSEIFQAVAPVKIRLPALDLGLALDLLRRERFGEAMEALRLLPPESANDPDVLLLTAVLLTNMGQNGDAERVCKSLLRADELNAGAHYLMALSREHAGNMAEAEEHDRTAVYLDAAFAMPWLHLGLLAKRNGKPEETRRHLEQSLTLLAKEDSSRILLFGGGFGREALTQLCRSEIHNLEGWA